MPEATTRTDHRGNKALPCALYCRGFRWLLGCSTPSSWLRRLAGVGLRVWVFQGLRVSGLEFRVQGITSTRRLWSGFAGCDTVRQSVLIIGMKHSFGPVAVGLAAGLVVPVAVAVAAALLLLLWRGCCCRCRYD